MYVAVEGCRGRRGGKEGVYVAVEGCRGRRGGREGVYENTHMQMHTQTLMCRCTHIPDKRRALGIEAPQGLRRHACQDLCQDFVGFHSLTWMR